MTYYTIGKSICSGHASGGVCMLKEIETRAIYTDYSVCMSSLCIIVHSYDS